MLNGVHLGSVEFDIGGFHHVAANGAGKETPNKFGHFDLRNVVQQTVDGHTQGGQQQAHGEHGDHPAVVQFGDSAGGNGFGLVVGVGLQVVAADEESGHRSANQGTHHIAQGPCGHPHCGGGGRCAHILKDGAKGGGGANPAGHGGGGALEGEQRVETHQVAHQHADYVLKGDKQAGTNGDFYAETATRPFQHPGAEAEAHAQEEQVLA